MFSWRRGVAGKMVKCFQLVCSMVLAFAHAQECDSTSDGPGCLGNPESFAVELLQTKTKHSVTKAEPVGTTEAPPIHVEPGHPDAELVQKEQISATREHEFVLDPWTEDAPAEQAHFYNLTEEQLKHVPRDFESLRLVQKANDQPIAYPNLYCGSAKRFDVAGFLGGGLSVDGCYLFSCVEPFKVSSTCGPYFYTNGNGNCKCCDYGSNYYTSAAGNNLYSCR